MIFFLTLEWVQWQSQHCHAVTIYAVHYFQYWIWTHLQCLDLIILRNDWMEVWNSGAHDSNVKWSEVGWSDETRRTRGTQASKARQPELYPRESDSERLCVCPRGSRQAVYERYHLSDFGLFEWVGCVFHAEYGGPVTARVLRLVALWSTLAEKNETLNDQWVRGRFFTFLSLTHEHLNGDEWFFSLATGSNTLAWSPLTRYSRTITAVYTQRKNKARDQARNMRQQLEIRSAG